MELETLKKVREGVKKMKKEKSVKQSVGLLFTSVFISTMDHVSRQGNDVMENEYFIGNNKHIYFIFFTFEILIESKAAERKNYFSKFRKSSHRLLKL